MSITLAKLTRNSRGNLQGKIQTLTGEIGGIIEIADDPNRKPNGPIKRVVIPGTDHEVGQVWLKDGDNGQYEQIIIDDPSWFNPISALLLSRDDGSDGLIVWSRPAKKQKSDQQAFA